MSIDLESRKPVRPRPRIAITLGDPNGVGPEIVLKCLSDSRLMKFFDPIIVGSAEVLRKHAEVLELPLPELQVVGDVPERITPERLVVVDVTGGRRPKWNLAKSRRKAGSWRWSPCAGPCSSAWTEKPTPW